MTIEFFVPGIPSTAGSKRAFHRPGMRFPVVVDTSGQRGKDWRGDVKRFALEAYQGAPLEGPLQLNVLFTMPRPKGHYRTGKRSSELRENAPNWHTSKPDALKMSRAIEDALTGILWRDDSQICVELLQKAYGDNPGALVRVEAIL